MSLIIWNYFRDIFRRLPCASDSLHRPAIDAEIPAATYIAGRMGRRESFRKIGPFLSLLSSVAVQQSRKVNYVATHHEIIFFNTESKKTQKWPKPEISLHIGELKKH